ncbi:MAG: sporulation protein YqfD [Clostridia bacterium]|nr:sporulation protein YqfD [Clostridia bacterium]
MLLTRFLRWLYGYVVITVSGPYPERFLSVCATRRILIWDVFPCGSNVLKCHVSIRGFRLLPPIICKTAVHVKIIEKRGFPLLFVRILKRKLFLIGLAVTMLSVIVLNQFIWKIEIVGCENLSGAHLTQKLSDYGLKVGAFRPYIDEKKIQNRMLIEIPELAWLWVNKSGSKVTVEIKERIMPPDMYDAGAYCDLIAAKDGVIHSMVIKNGVPMVSLGDTVRQGDLLVSGLILSEKGVEPRQVQSEGEVRARVWYEKTKAFSLLSPVQNETGKTEKKHTLHLFGKDVNLFHSAETTFSDYSKESIEKELSFFGYYLGLGISSTIFKEQNITYEKNTVESTVQKGALELSTAIDEETTTDSMLKESRTEHTVIDEDTVLVTVVAEYIENIAQKNKP